jgi:DNA-binding Lrp family transcriptional regulator
MQEDASRTNADLSAEVGLSPSSCLRRIRRLKSAGIIDRVVALLNPAKAGRGMKAIVTVELERHGEQHMRRFLELAVMEPAVIQAYSVSGSTDAVLMLRLTDMEEFDALCERLFRDRTNVARYYTMFVIRTAKETTAIPL